MHFKRSEMDGASFNLVSAEGLVIDFHESEKESDFLVFTFTERTSRTLDGIGFSGAFLRKIGVNIVSVKTDRDLWYENLLDEHVATVNMALAKRNQKYVRVGYGSSMGAYAAIRFSRAFFLDRVFAISPLFDIKPVWERRWKADIPALSNLPMMRAEYVSDQCQYFICYDPKEPDGKHFDNYRSIIPEEQIFEIKTPYAGHPSGYFLLQIGMLQDMATSIICNGKLPPGFTGYFPNKRRSHTYLFCFAAECLRRHRYSWALAANTEAIKLEPKNAEYYMQRGIVLDRLGQILDAAEACRSAIDLAPSRTHYKGFYESVISKIAS